jgi:hypothetical protein
MEMPSPQIAQDSGRIQSILSPRSPWQYAVFCFLTFGLNKLSNRFPDWADFIFGSFLLAVFFFMWFSDWRRSRLCSKMMSFHPVKKPPAAAKGLILLVSPYDPREPNLRDENSLRSHIELVLRKPLPQMAPNDFDRINLSKSNLRPLIDAVAYHMDRNTLRDVWLITSEYDPESAADLKTVRFRGSDVAADLLEKYFNFRFGERITIHRQDLSVKPWDYVGLCKKAENIFRRSGFKEDVVLADVTGGTKMMSVALAMACIAPNRKMQYMDSERDWQGQPLTGDRTEPVMIDVNPIIYGNE